MPASADAADASAARSSSVPARVFGRLATIVRSDAPTADARAAAEPPPGVGVGALNTASRSRTDLSARSMKGVLTLPVGDGLQAVPRWAGLPSQRGCRVGGAALKTGPYCRRCPP